MAIRYGCFFSYAHGRYDLMIRFKTALADALRCYLEPYFDNEDELFVDHEQLGGGDDIDRKIARAHVRERHHDHDLHAEVRGASLHPPRIRRHAAARGRTQQVVSDAEPPDHPGDHDAPPDQLPPQITNSSLYVDFSHFTMATADLKSNLDFIPDIDKIVKRIVTHYQYQKMYTPAGHDCNQFVLPDVPPEWRDIPEISFPKK